MVADSLIPPSRLSYGSGRSTSCQRVRHAAYLSERDPSEPRRSNSFTRCCRLRHRVDDQLDRLHVCCRSQSVSKRGRTDDAFSRRAGYASISTLDVRTGRFWANSISTRLRSRRDCSKASVPASALPRHLAVPFCRSKFTDWLAGAVPNSYPNVDLLWDSVIAGPWGWPRSTVQARVPARR